jgi:glycosyltransferase involved in cell wall biosynthesis
MSPGNVSYVLAHNPSVDPVKLHELPNWIAERHVLKGKAPAESFRASWGVEERDLLCVFGGNLGKPQQVGFLADVANLLRDEPNIRIVIVGRGTESQSIKREIAEQNLPNVVLRERLPRDEYQQLLSAADVGFVLLNKRFTIPNIPSRLTGYWAAGVAVLAATDTATDLNEAFLTKYGGGEWVRMSDASAFAKKLRYYLKNRELVSEMGERGRQAILQHFTARKAAATILRQMTIADGITN